MALCWLYRGTFAYGRMARFGQALKPSKASQQLSKASAPHNPPQQLSKRPAGFAMVPPCASLLAPKAVSIGLRNCRVARSGQALKASKASQQLSKASAPHNPPQQLSKRPAGFAMVPPCASLLAPKAVSIGLQNCRVARSGQALKASKASQQLSKASAPHNPPQQLSKRPAGSAMWCLHVPFYWPYKLFHAVSIGLRNCRVARFGQALKASKASQQLSKASAPHNPPQQLSMVPTCASLLARKAVSIGLRNCRVARSGQALKPSKASQQLSKASAPHNPPQQLEACCWLCHGASMCLPNGPKSCFYWASKLPRGTFWAGLKSFKSLAAAFEGLSTAQPSAAALEASCWLCHGASMCLPIGPTSCFYWASKLPRGTFWAGLKIQKPRSSFRRLQHRTTLRSSSRSVLLALPWCLHVPPYWLQKLFLLGFETAAWHVLGRP